MTPPMRQIFAGQPFDQKLKKLSQMVVLAKQVNPSQLPCSGDYVKERRAMFAGETVESLFAKATSMASARETTTA